jgi:hypothetical protein
MEIAAYVVSFLGGSALLLAAVGYLVKQLITHNLNLDVESFKADLKLKSETEIQRLAHNLKLDAEAFKADLKLKSETEIQRLAHDLRLGGLAYEHKVALLHAKRAEVIAELYKNLQSIINHTRDYATTSNDNVNELFHGWKSAIEEFTTYFDNHKIYFTAELCALIDTLENEILDSSIKAAESHEALRNEALAPSEILKYAKMKSDAVKMLDTHVPPIKTKITKEFRQLLGVDNEPLAES